MTHMLNTSIAKICGTNAALVFNYINLEIMNNKMLGIKMFLNKYWTDISVKQLQQTLDYLSNRQIECAIHKLENACLLQSDYLNPNKMNRIKWYSITDKALEITQGGN